MTSSVLEQLEHELIQRAPFLVVLEDGPDHRSLQVEIKMPKYPTPFAFRIVEREGRWVAHDAGSTARAVGWLWGGHPASVKEVLLYHGVEDVFGELALTVTPEDVCPQLVHLMAASVELVAMSRRLRAAKGIVHQDPPA